MTKTTATKSATKKPRRMAREPQGKPASKKEAVERTNNKDGDRASLGATSKPQAKFAIIVGLLTRSQGATLHEMVEATGWLPHTARAALTGLKKKGFTITSEKVDNVRTYRAIDEVEPDKPLAGDDSADTGS